LDIEWTLWINI